MIDTGLRCILYFPERTAARAAKDWTTSDRIRDELIEMGIAIKDGPEGTTWTKVVQG